MLKRRRTITALTLAATWAIVLSTTRAESPATAFATGSRLRQALDEPIGASWSGQSLRSAVESLAANRKTAVVLDRRVDPNVPIELSVADTAVGAVLDKLAAQAECRVVRVGDALFLTTPATAAALPQTIAARNAEANGQPTDLRTALARTAPLEWNLRAEPRDVLRRLAAEAGLRWTNEAAVPHDLLYPAAVPPATLVERLSLVAAGFGMTYHVDPTARTLELRPLPEADAATAPDSPPPRPSTNPKPAVPGTQVYTLAVQNVPLAKLVEVLRAKHGLNVRFDDEAIRAAGISTAQLTSVNVRDATLVELLDQAAAPLGLKAQQVGDAVVIGTK